MSEHPSDGSERIPPIEELQDFALEEDPEFPGRIRRSLNRHLLMGDSLEFSLNIFQKTVWEYLKNVVEIWPARKGDKTE